VNVRSVAWTDFEGLYALRQNRYDRIEVDPDYGMVSQPSRPTPADFALWFGQLHHEILDGKSVASIAEIDGRLVGACTIRPEGPHVETQHIGILGIEVLEGFLDRGVGSALLGHALDGCRGRFEEVHLAVIPVNERARHLYERHGFELYGTAPRSFRRGSTYHDFLLMRKRIG
jgi:RimJ/RimL family protein N-acetyltransferase